MFSDHKKIFSENNLAIQEASFSCGPCTLLNVLHLKNNFSYNEKQLIEICDSKSGAGTSNENLIKAAQQIGLQIVEKRINAQIEDIENQLYMGNYVIVNYYHAFNGDGHYAAITECDERSLYLRDCSLGLLRLLKEDFTKFWHNSDKSIYGWYVAVK